MQLARDADLSDARQAAVFHLLYILSKVSFISSPCVLDCDASPRTLPPVDHVGGVCLWMD
jgi:hypothetical protein